MLVKGPSQAVSLLCRLAHGFRLFAGRRCLELCSLGAGPPTRQAGVFYRWMHKVGEPSMRRCCTACVLPCSRRVANHILFLMSCCSISPLSSLDIFFIPSFVLFGDSCLQWGR